MSSHSFLLKDYTTAIIALVLSCTHLSAQSTASIEGPSEHLSVASINGFIEHASVSVGHTIDRRTVQEIPLNGRT
jgi:hypothetical protein